jgi:Ca2+-binding RTX toxin-like protein
VLRVIGTGDDDVIRISLSPSMSRRLIVNINGKSAKFTLSKIQRIFVYGRAGDDKITIDRKYGAIFTSSRLMGEAGADTLTGGDGKDSLYGADGKDRLFGGGGADRLEGGGGTDRLYGQGGRDLFAYYKKIELMDWSNGDRRIS